MDNAQRRVLGLAAVATWFAIDSVRTAGPLLSDLFDVGVTVSAGAGVGTFIAGALIAWLATYMGRSAGHGNALVIIAVAMVTLRFVLPFLAEDTLVRQGLVATAFAIAFLILAVRTAVGVAGGAGALAGTALGVAAAVLEQTMLRTWDAVWRDDALGWAALVLVGVLVIVNAWRCRAVATDGPVRGWWAYGLYMSLVLYALGNIAFVNSQSTLRMSLASLVIVAGLLAGAYLVSRPAGASATYSAVLALLAIPATAVVMFMPGAAAAMALPVAAASLTVAAALALRRADAGSSIRFLGAAVAFALLTLLPFMLVQLDYDIPLGVPHVLVMVLAATGVAIAGALKAGATGASKPTSGAAALEGVTMRVGVGLGLAALVAGYTMVNFEQPRAYTMEFIDSPRLLVWNVHYGVTPGLSGGPSVDLDQIVATIREQDPDVLLLQEVDRGWILAGGVDVLEYLAGELDMEFAYAPAHDPQFGNAIFTSRPMTNVRILELPYGEGPQHRSAIGADFMGATYVSIHLQHRSVNTPTRVEQLEYFVHNFGVTGPVVVGGDFNDVPDSEPFLLMLNERYISAQDDAGFTGDTYVGPDFQDRIDYIFGRSVTFSEFEVVDSPWSDHLPLAVTVTPDQ